MLYFDRPWPLCDATQDNLICKHTPGHDGEHEYTHHESALEEYYG